MALSFYRIHRKHDGTYYIPKGHAPKNHVTMMVCDVNSKVIYYRPQPGCAFNSDFLCPYISKNGKYCRFIDNKIVEID